MNDARAIAGHCRTPFFHLVIGHSLFDILRFRRLDDQRRQLFNPRESRNDPCRLQCCYGTIPP